MASCMLSFILQHTNPASSNPLAPSLSRLLHSPAHPNPLAPSLLTRLHTTSGLIFAMNPSMNPPVNQPMNPPMNPSMNPTVNPPTNTPMNPTANTPANQTPTPPIKCQLKRGKFLPGNGSNSSPTSQTASASQPKPNAGIAPANPSGTITAIAGTSILPLRPKDVAFGNAVQSFIQSLDAGESGYIALLSTKVDPDQLIQHAKGLDQKNKDTSKARFVSLRVAKLLHTFNVFVNAACICIQHSPEISSLVLGGVKLVLDVLYESGSD